MIRSMAAALFAVALSCIAVSAVASCGSASCPLDLNALNRPEVGRFSLDLSFDYIDQDQPRIGTRDAAVGEIHAHHDEVRTINRNVNFLLRYAATDRWQFSIMAPYISRSHEHIHNHAGEQEPEHWNLSGQGDVQLQTRYRFAPGFWALAGVKLPTGADSRANGEGEVAETPIQPGTGSTDYIAGIGWESGVVRSTMAHGPMGNAARIPLFASLTFRRNGTGAADYHFGNEWQASAGGAYPLRTSLELLLQANARRRLRDRDPDDPGAFTGGTYAYVSPGLRWSGRRGSVYALIQLPVYQDVNGIQLTSKRNWVTGVQKRF